MPLFSLKKRLKRFTNLITKKSSNNTLTEPKTCSNGSGYESVTAANSIKNDLTYPIRDEKNAYRDYSKNREVLGVCGKNDRKQFKNEDKLCNVNVSKNVGPKDNVAVSIAQTELSELKNYWSNYLMR